MISPSIVEEVKRLLRAGGLSHRKIARRLGVSRGTVNAIASDKRPQLRPQNKTNSGIAAPAGPLTRCPGCGGLVLMPCLACRVRAMRERGLWEAVNPNRLDTARRLHRSPATQRADSGTRR